MARWDNEVLKWNQPDEKEIRCRNCYLRAKDRCDGKVKGATLALCDAYPTFATPKPNAILWENADCPYFIDEED